MAEAQAPRSEEEQLARIKMLRGEKPYVYEEYPRMLFRSEDGVNETMIVNDAAALEEALEDGWTKDVPPPVTKKAKAAPVATVAPVSQQAQDPPPTPRRHATGRTRP